MADLIGSVGKIELEINEGFEELATRIVNQHHELLAIEANRLLPSQSDSQAIQVKNALWQSALNTGGEKVASHGSPIGALAASPNSYWLASGSGDQTVRLWTMHLQDLISLGCRLAGRNLNPSKWEQYFYQQEYHKTCP